MSGWRRYYGQDWPPVPDGAGGFRPITKEFAAMLIAKKWKFFKDEQGIEFKDENDSNPTPTPVELRWAYREETLNVKQFTMLSK